MIRVDICQLEGLLCGAINNFGEDTVFYSSEVEKINQSWFSFLFFREKRSAMENFKKHLHAMWIDRIKTDIVDIDDHALKVISSRIDVVAEQACFNLGREIKPEMTLGEIDAISLEIKRSMIAVGHKPSYHSSFEEEKDDTKRLLFQFLLEEVPPLDTLAREHLLKALLWKKDPEFLLSAREGVQETLHDLFIWTAEDPSHIGSNAKLPIEAAIGNLLAIYTFLDPQEGEVLTVPQKIGGRWHNIPYSLKKIQMTPSLFFSPMHAFGLSPVEQNALFPSLLLFKGTTYPTDDGAFLSILSDLNPFASIGGYVFWMGKDLLKNWIDEHTAHKKIRVFGASLGGSLGLQAGINFFSQVELVHAFSPPALFNRDIKKWEDIPKDSRPSVYVYCNEGDVIPHLGSGWGEGWNLIHVIASQNYNPFLSHCRVFAADDVIMLDRNIKRDDESFTRRLLSTIQLVASIPIFCFLAIIFAIYTVIKKCF